MFDPNGGEVTFIGATDTKAPSRKVGHASRTARLTRKVGGLQAYHPHDER